MIGSFVTSKSGHDKNRIYIVIEENDDSVFLADGEWKKLAAPKKKNRKHVQPINQTCGDPLLTKLQQHETVYDEEIKRAIKLYRRNVCQNLM